MKFGKHPRRLSAEEWFQHRFAHVLPPDGEPTDPENCPSIEVLRSYALREKTLVLDPPTLHILECARCRRRVAEVRQEFFSLQDKHERAQVRLFMKATGLLLMLAVLLGLFSLVSRFGSFARRTTPVTLNLVNGKVDRDGVAPQIAGASFSMPAALVALQVYLPPGSGTGAYEVAVLPARSSIAAATAVVKPVQGRDGQELNLKLDLRQAGTGTYVLRLRSGQSSTSCPLWIHQP